MSASRRIVGRVAAVLAALAPVVAAWHLAAVPHDWCAEHAGPEASPPPA